MGSRRSALCIALTIGAVALVQQAWVSPTNFGGADEWLLLDLASRGVLGVPYANRPLVLLWQAPPAHLLPVTCEASGSSRPSTSPQPAC